MNNKRVINTYIVDFHGVISEVKELANGQAYIQKWINDRYDWFPLEKEEFYELIA